MKDYLGIKEIKAIEVFDSRGNPTLQVEVITDGGFSGVAVIPSGASTGKFEAIELRDKEESRLFGKGVKKAVNNVNKKVKLIFKTAGTYFISNTSPAVKTFLGNFSIFNSFLNSTFRFC